VRIQKGQSARTPRRRRDLDESVSFWSPSAGRSAKAMGQLLESCRSAIEQLARRRGGCQTAIRDELAQDVLADVLEFIWKRPKAGARLIGQQIDRLADRYLYRQRRDACRLRTEVGPSLLADPRRDVLALLSDRAECEIVAEVAEEAKTRMGSEGIGKIWAGGNRDVRCLDSLRLAIRLVCRERLRAACVAGREAEAGVLRPLLSIVERRARPDGAFARLLDAVEEYRAARECSS